MTMRRTDLALEARELWQESAGETTKLPGWRPGMENGRACLSPQWTFWTRRGKRPLASPRAAMLLSLWRGWPAGRGTSSPAQYRPWPRALPAAEGYSSPGAGAGGRLGNRAITPDAIGPKVHNYTLVTRHLVRQMPETFGAFRPVASLAAEVMGTTGVESGELIQSLCEKICPHCVIAVDALASRSLHRLCRTVQLTDTGITPGSGVGNHRMGLDRKSLGVPVIAIGVPTVVDAATLAADLMGVEELPDLGEGRDLLVTPKDIDSQVGDLSKIIGYAIDLALQPGLTIEELELLLS